MASLAVGAERFVNAAVRHAYRQKAGETQNPGYVVAVLGDAVSVLGSAVAIVPGAGTVVGGIINSVGTVISALGTFIGDSIEQGKKQEAIAEYLGKAGVDPELIDVMSHAGKALLRETSSLGMSAEQVQALLKIDPLIGVEPSKLSQIAGAYGLQGQEVVDFAQKLHDQDPDAFKKLYTDIPGPEAGSDRRPMIREYLATHFKDADAFARALEQSSSTSGGADKTPQEKAADDYAGIRTGDLGEVFDKAKGLVEASDDPAYKQAIVEMLRKDGVSEELLIGLAD